MPPVQPSLRASLLTGASAIALSVSASGVQAQGVEQGKPTLTVWAEGALFLTARDTYNIPTLPGLTTPFTAFSPRSGYEGAVGFDFRWAAE